MPRPRPNLTLRRRSPLPPWLGIAWRVGALFGVILLMIVVHWLERDGLRDNYDGHVSFADVSMMPLLQLDCEAKPACSMPTEKLFVDTPCRLHCVPLT